MNLSKINNSLQLKTSQDHKCNTIEFINENGVSVIRSDKCDGTISQSVKKFAEIPIFIIANIDSVEEINPTDIPTILDANNHK